MPTRLRNVVVPWCRVDVIPVQVGPDGCSPVRLVLLARPDTTQTHRDGVTIDLTAAEARQLLTKLTHDLDAIEQEDAARGR